MVHTRRFLVPPSFARLIRKEFGTQGRVLEGYFSSTPERSHLVRIDPAACSLVIVLRDQDGAASEEVTKVPYSQAQALLDVAQGKVAYDITHLALGSAFGGVLDRVVATRPLDLLSFSFASASEAEHFQPPVWVGPDVSGDPSFDKAAIALHGAPEVGKPEISNAALEALLDLLDGGLYARSMQPIEVSNQAAHQPQQPAPDWLARARDPAGDEHPEATQEAVSATSSWASQRIRRAAG